MNLAPNVDDRILPWRRVKDLTGLSRTTAWRLQRAGDFPRPLAISPGRVGWRESELLAWSASRTPRAAANGAPPEPDQTAPPAAPSPPTVDAATAVARAPAPRREPQRPSGQLPLAF